MDQTTGDFAADKARSATFTTHDGTVLFYRAWPAAPRPHPAKGIIVLLHRGHEHSGRVAHLVEELGLEDYDFYAWDARGHGQSPGLRGHSPSFAASIRDLDCFIGHIRAETGRPMADIAIIAQSVGAVLAAGWVHDYAPAIRALVLASPAFDINLYVPFAKQAIALWQGLVGSFFVNSYVKPQYLTHDPARIESYRVDPLITRPIASHILLDVYAAGARLVADARAITVPVQMLISGRDFVVRAAPQHRFFEGLGSRIKERHVLEGFFHDTLGERDRAPALALIRRFITERFAAAVETADLTDADRHGHTRDEAERLATPLSPFSLRGLYWALTRAGIRFGARLSKGLSVGVTTGFDSGSTLDYVYENQPRGLGPGGRLIDRQFLNAIGWRGIRQRKLHLQELIGLALERLREGGRSTHVVDIACGHGRYVLDAVEATGRRPDSIRLRDYAPINVEAGRRAIASRGLTALASMEAADAFDGDALAGLEPGPDLAIVSGLYELFSDNRLVARSLDGLARAMAPGSILLYTNQPWHPQLEMIARALTSHRGGQAWVMRRRTQQEMDQLVEAAGFDKVEQRIDPWGIFTVSLAVRRETAAAQTTARGATVAGTLASASATATAGTGSEMAAGTPSAIGTRSKSRSQAKTRAASQPAPRVQALREDAAAPVSPLPAAAKAVPEENATARARARDKTGSQSRAKTAAKAGAKARASTKGAADRPSASEARSEPATGKTVRRSRAKQPKSGSKA